jgi:Tfp pilus assembly protein PilO
VTGAFHWKRLVRWAIIAVLAADAGLLFWNWQWGGAAPQSQAAQRDQLRKQHEVLGQDVRHAADISKRIPEIEKQCEGFLTEQLLPSNGAYSALAEDLNRISRESGLQARGISYRQNDLPDRRVVEVEVSASVEGNYQSLVKFINGLERSQQFYLLENLALVESSSGAGIRLNLNLKTYFRLKT